MTISLKDIGGPFSEEELSPETTHLAETFLSLYLDKSLSAPNKIFPEDTVAPIYERAAKFLKGFPKKKKRTL